VRRLGLLWLCGAVLVAGAAGGRAGALAHDATPGAPLRRIARDLYEADAGGGFAAWGRAPGWQVFDGALLSDGTASGALAAPYDPGDAGDYAVEAEVRLAPADCGGRPFGVFARSAAWGAYWAGPDCAGSVGIWGGDGPTPGAAKAEAPFAPGGGWHTYRLEARGTELRLLVDGALVLETHEARVLADGRVGVFSGGEQVTVRRFAVIAL
jgi:Domain of Unknown Function (DUF1080)